MGKPLTIQIEDENKIEELKDKIGAKTKIEVIRRALSLLEEDVEKNYRIERWKKAAKLVGNSSMEVFQDFNTRNRFKKLT